MLLLGTDKGAEVGRSRVKICGQVKLMQVLKDNNELHYYIEL